MGDAIEPQQEPVESAGAMLHDERRRQSLSVGDVSRQLKLSTRQVEALERDDYQVFGGPVFVHGFLRNYAKLLGIDAARLIGAADRKLASAAPAPRSQRDHGIDVPLQEPGGREQRSVMPLFLVAAILVAGIAAWMLMRQQETTPAGGVPEGMVSSQYPDGDAVGTDAASDDVVSLTEPGADVAPDPQQATAGTPRDSVAPAAPGRNISPVEQVRLQLGFREESWVEVTDRYGEVIFAELVPRGVARAISGSPPLTVVIGNAAGVDLVFNGKPINLSLHTRVDVARLTLE
jgi:cytoskeleton protein RodZ